jgi:uncharacterized protein YeaO (DUF488 family)
MDLAARRQQDPRPYHHDPDRVEEFTRRYCRELTRPPRADVLQHLRELGDQHTVTLLNATTDAGCSEAAVLAQVLGGGR